MTILLYPDEVKFNSFGMRNGTLVPITAKHPEAAIQFVNWAYSSQENHDLLALGIEGVHWRESDTVLTWNNPYAAGSKTSWQSPAVEKIVDPETNQALYNHWVFLIGQLRWMRISPLSHPSQLEERDPALYRRRGQRYHRIRVRFVTGSDRVREPQGNDRGERVAHAIRCR